MKTTVDKAEATQMGHSARALELVVFVAAASSATPARAQTGPYSFFAVAPCRVVDTRGANATNGGPALNPHATRDFSIRGNCGVPASAAAVSLNVTIANPTAASWLSLWPSGSPRPNVSTINF